MNVNFDTQVLDELKRCGNYAFVLPGDSGTGSGMQSSFGEMTATPFPLLLGTFTGSTKESQRRKVSASGLFLQGNPCVPSMSQSSSLELDTNLRLTEGTVLSLSNHSCSLFFGREN